MSNHRFSISKLEKSHDRQSFDCGNEALNRFLKNLASQIVKRHEATIYVAHVDNKVVGYYTLSADKIHQLDDPNLLKNQSPYTGIPCILIGRLAIDKVFQGQGIGQDLLAHALVTVKNIAQNVGVAFVVVDAKDENAKRFYEQFGFLELQNQPLRLCFPVVKL